MSEKCELLIYSSDNDDITLEVEMTNESVWLSLDQMAKLFGRDKSVISRHIRNIFLEGELRRDSVVAKNATTAADGKNYNVDHYNLDVIISIGYRVKSREGVVFRKWASKILQEYLIKGYAINQRRLDELKATVTVLRRTNDLLDVKQVLDVVEAYTDALELLDDYDHQVIKKPFQGNDTNYRLSYEECRSIIDRMQQEVDSDLFGRERDGVFEGALNTIYSTFDGIDLYPTIEEKAAHLLYFLVKDHGLYDGNKRVATALFLEFLNKNQRLFVNGKKAIENNTLVALVIMMAESRPQEKDLMVNLVMNFLM